MYCLLSLFYIKPQLFNNAAVKKQIVFYLFSTSNHNLLKCHSACEKIVFYLFSTSNHNFHRECKLLARIVFYLFSTSNHNPHVQPPWQAPIVFYLFSTSNHNLLPDSTISLQLSFISFLHQTTTPLQQRCWKPHCLLSLFYIKPQPSLAVARFLPLSFISFLHQTTTSATI